MCQIFQGKELYVIIWRKNKQMFIRNVLFDLSFCSVEILGAMVFLLQ